MVFLTYTVWRKKKKKKVFRQIYVKPKANRPLIMDTHMCMFNSLRPSDAYMRQ